MKDKPHEITINSIEYVTVERPYVPGSEDCIECELRNLGRINGQSPCGPETQKGICVSRHDGPNPIHYIWKLKTDLMKAADEVKASLDSNIPSAPIQHTHIQDGNVYVTRLDSSVSPAKASACAACVFRGPTAIGTKICMHSGPSCLCMSIENSDGEGRHWVLVGKAETTTLSPMITSSGMVCTEPRQHRTRAPRASNCVWVVERLDPRTKKWKIHSCETTRQLAYLLANENRDLKLRVKKYTPDME